MKEHNETQNRDLDAWEPLRAANTRMLNSFHVKLLSETVAAAPLSSPHEKSDVERSNEGCCDETQKNESKQHRAYVDYGLRQLAAFERCAAGLEVWPRRRGRG
jgi:hypothetical protein